MVVESCTESSRWDAYVAASKHATNAHGFVWKQVIEDTYAHSTHYLMASADGRVQGVLPLVWIRSRVFGSFLVSVPYLSFGGVVADSREARDALLSHAVEMAAELRARHIELRQGDLTEPPWRQVTARVSMQVPLPATVDEFAARLSGRLRTKIRSARKHGLRAVWGGVEAVESFYTVFATNMRDLGTPVYPRRWFETVCRLLPESRILTLREGHRPVAATLLMALRDTVELPWIASVPEARQKYSTVLLYWTALEWAIQNGYRRVDLGRCTPGSGVHQFKKQWTCEEKPLPWSYWLAPGASVPEMRPDNPRYRWAIRLWQHLPLGVANWLGPHIVRSIP